MSRIGCLPILVPSSVRVRIEKGDVFIKGPKGELSCTLPMGISMVQEKNILMVQMEGNEKKTHALRGTYRSLLHNMVIGVSDGFRKELDIVGVGYRASVKGLILSLTVGYSHPVDFKLPTGITAKVEKNTHLILEGTHKQLLGDVAARIRAVRYPEPYQGKGIRYTNEKIRRKQGKAAGAK